MDSFYDIGFDTYDDKLPTLKAYLKSLGKKTLPKQFHVSLIWIPNKFPSYSLHCDKFRLSVSVKSPIGRALGSNLNNIVDNNTPLSIVVVINEDKTEQIRFKQSGESGGWDVIGTDNILGYRFVQI